MNDKLIEARVKKTGGGPLLFIGNLEVRSWLGCAYDGAAEALAKSINAELARAASAVLGDQGLREAAQTVVDNWGADLTTCVSMRPHIDALKAALARQAQDGPAIGDEQVAESSRKIIAERLAWLAAHTEGEARASVEIISSRLRLGHAAAPSRPEPSQSVNYVSAPHDDPKMKCESCGTEQWPMCKVCGATLAEKTESTQENFPCTATGIPAASGEFTVRTNAGAFVPAESTQEPPSQQGAEPRPLNARDQSARDAGCTCWRKMPYTDWTHDSECPLYRPMDSKPAPVQPFTDDVVERSSAAYIAAYGETLMTFGERHLRGIAAAVSLARAGWHSWESVERELRENLTLLEYVDPRAMQSVLETIKASLSRVRLEAEPAERVTDPAVEVIRGMIKMVRPALDEKLRDEFTEQIVAAVRKADAQGGKGQ